MSDSLGAIDETLNPALNDPAIFTTYTGKTSLFEAFGYRFTTKTVNITDLANRNTKFTATLNTGECFVPQNSDLRLFNPDDPYHEVINTTDQDWMFTYGVQIRYYKVKPIEEQRYFDDLYGEAPNRLYEGAVLERNSKLAYLTEVNPTVLYGVYDPSEMTQDLTINSIDTNRNCQIYFNIVYLKNMLGRDPVIGDIVIPWDVPEQIYEVRTIKLVNKTLYMPRRYKLTCELIQLSI